MTRFDDALDLALIATPSASPSSNRAFIYPKSDGQWYYKNSSGVEVLSGTKGVPTPTTGTDSANKSYVDSQVSGMAAVGQQLGLAQRFTTAAFTNTTLWSTAAGARIGSLSISITGTGRPIQIEFRCPYFTNSGGSNVHLQAWFIRTTPASGGTTIAQELTTVPAIGILGGPIYLSSTQSLTNGTTYKFEVGICTNAAITATLQAGQIPTWTVDWPMYLSATQR